MQQPVSPYRLNGQLGHCPVGSVWAAVDEQGRPLTLAVLDAAAATDQRWRRAFAETVNALAQPGPDRPHYVQADISAAQPWAAYAGAAGAGAGAERVFESLGMQVLAADPPTGREDVAQTARIVRQPAASPTSPMPAWNTPSAGFPVEPASAQPVSADPYGMVYSAPPDQDPFAGPVRRIEPSTPARKRTGRWLAIAGVVVVFLAVGGTVYALTGRDDPDPTPTATGAGPRQQQQAAALPTTPPASPGVEPPKAGAGWPAKWPHYSPWEKVHTLQLAGLGFPLKVPATWQCTLAGQAEGQVKYNCGTAPSEATQYGGEIVVRDCAQPCDERQQTELRKGEEAWGARWIRSGPFSTYAESQIQADGEQRHALVVVAFYRGDAGEVDHQLVFRMTGPINQAPQLRKVATYLRDTLVF